MSVLITNMEEIPEHGTVMVVVHANDGKKYIKPLGFLGCSMELVEQRDIAPAVERAEGEWLPDNSGEGFWVCSRCKFPSEAFAADKLYKYCPRCGAKMEESDE